MTLRLVPAVAVALLALGAAGLGGAPRASAIEPADRLWLVGERALQDRLYPLSRRTLEALIERYPADPRIPEAVLLLGKARLGQGALEGALEAFRRAQAFSPRPGKPEEARFWEGETLFRLKRYKEAREVHDRLLADNAASPFAPDALYGLAWAERELRHPEAAAVAFKNLITAFPEHGTVPAATVHLARTLVELERAEEAVPLLRGFVDKHPEHALLPEARYLLGLARVSAGQTAEGVGDLRAFAAAYPKHALVPQARRLVVDTLLKEGKKTELAEEYKALVALSPQTAESRYDAGVIASRLGRGRDAESAWKGLRSEFPDHPLAARASLDLAQSAFGRSAYKDAVPLARAAAKSEEPAVRAQALLLVGESELKLKRFPAAHEAFKGAAEAAGEDAGVRFRALAGSGLALEEQGRLSQAVKYYDQVAAASPDKELRAWAKARRSAVAAKLKPAPKR